MAPKILTYLTFKEVRTILCSVKAVFRSVKGTPPPISLFFHISGRQSRDYLPYWGSHVLRGTQVKDIKVPSNAPSELLLPMHRAFIHGYESKKEDYEYVMTEYLRLSGIYWGLTTMALINHLDDMNKQEVIDLVVQCQHECGGFGASVKYDPHLLYTLSAVQILCLYDCIQLVDKEKIVEFVCGLQQPDGSFFGDKWGEVDTRFSFCALACLTLLGRLDAIDVDKAVTFVLSCMNFDGGFGSVPGSESHAGQIYCCLGSLSITNSLHHVDSDLLGWWLCERQLPSGGFNGRPEKLPDVCYTWWVLSSLKILGKLHWIDKEKLTTFILACQDDETGGFADRPGNMVDPFHTLFGIAGLSILEHDPSRIMDVDPVFCLPSWTLTKLGIRTQLLDS